MVNAFRPTFDRSCTECSSVESLFSSKLHQIDIDQYVQVIWKALASQNVEAKRHRGQACLYKADRWAEARDQRIAQEGVCCCVIAPIRRILYWGPILEQTVDRNAMCVLGDLQVTVFQQEHYLENFVQATFDALPEEKLTGKYCYLYRRMPMITRQRFPPHALHTVSIL